MAEVVFGWAIRTRTVKGSFWSDEDIAELTPMTRFVFIGLFAVADREGRFPDRARKVKRLLFPGDNIDVEEAMGALEMAGFLVRYVVNGLKLVQIRNFKKHQNVHPSEAKSTLPGPPTQVGSKLGPTEIQLEKGPIQRESRSEPSEPSEPSTKVHTQGTAVRETAPPVPTPPARVSEPPAPKPGTNAEIESRWNAAMQGFGLKLHAGQAGYHVAQKLYNESESDDEARAVAKHFAGTLSAGITKNPHKFVADYAIRKANWLASKEPVEATCGVRRCNDHPGGPYDRKGNCERCASAAQDEARA